MAKLYMVGNTHFDPVWEWTWDEAMASIRATFRSALDRMKEYPDFCYSFSTPPVFEWIKKTDPAMFKEIQERVAEGRWDLAEGWWVQPDCYSASGESYARQGLYGQRYLKENFGKYSESMFNCDSFGHPDMLPQILTKSGIKYYCLCRPEKRHCKLNSPFFKWTSSDGSSILAYRLSEAGESWAKDTKAEIEAKSASDEDMIVVYGVTDHGGAPTKKSIEEIMESDNAVFSSVEGYFKSQGEPKYEIRDEFITGDFGVYCNHIAVKQANRAAEYAALNAERSSVIAGENKNVELEGCWQDIAFNQFHDILGGSCVKEAYTDARNLHGRALQTANEIMHYNLQRVTAQMNMPGKNPDTIWNLVVWNMNGSEYNGYIEAEVQWAHEFEWYEKGITLEDAQGNRYEAQVISTHSSIPRFRSRFIFKAAIPPMGYKCFKIIRNERDLPVKRSEVPEVVETEKYIFKLDLQKGFVKEIYCKDCQKTVAKNVFVPVCYRDNGDNWCFNIDSYSEKLGSFKVTKAEVTEDGEELLKLKLTLKYNESVLYMYYTFYKREGYFDLDYRVNWNEKHTVLKFESDTENRSVVASTPYSSMEREESCLDRPVGEWLKSDNLLYVTNGIFAYNHIDGKLGLTVLRSPIYGEFRIGDLEERDYEFMSQGITDGKIRVFAKDARGAEEAQNLNNPPVVVCESNHSGTLPAESCYFECDSENVLLGALKHCEEGDGVIVRIADYSGESREVKIRFEDTECAILLGGNEIKTLKFANGTAVEVNILEEG